MTATDELVTDGLLDFAHQALALATDARAGPVRTFKTGGRVIAMAENTPCIADAVSDHFPACEEPAEAFIYAHYGGEDAPVPPADIDDLWFSHVIQGLQVAGLRGFYHKETDHWELFDPKKRVGIRLLPDPSATPVWEASSPLANFVAWVAEASAECMVHAGTLAGTRAALVVGPGGSGKSTTICSAIAHGMQTAGDDYVILSEAEGTVTARAVTERIKLSRASMDFAGHVLAQSPALSTNFQDKYVFPISTLAEGAFEETQEVDCILLPSVTHGERTRIRPASRASAFQALTETTMRQIATNNHFLIPFCAEISRMLPAYHFELGRDRDEIVSTVGEWLTR